MDLDEEAQDLSTTSAKATSTCPDNYAVISVESRFFESSHSKCEKIALQELTDSLF
ncbi:uncharacterized protein PHALS_06262 [Plasmopara halstedii]|uniref:Uncharacterized protein n=1 Tax=Plasmopara halstedii TaxID=4781 RepID=A0A0P1B3J4_PLAHL|nr:uncharacterized protein PHALS_06262 [Plasmopara halstedii]CEG48442.1 hypothetical protein PHALS_06262 [Plasmopara halstedii]|eukprot:XP_024584811.1 hypothetical protein PHALS_06262 [Plasmopara halstedii]